MILHSHMVVLCLWCAQPIVQSVVAVVFWRRKLYKQFPVFFVFLLAQVTNFAVLFPLWITGNRSLYFGPSWVGEAINAILGFKVIHEVFLDVFRPYRTLKDLGTLVFKWAGVVMLLVAVVVALSNSFDENPWMHALTTLQRSIRVAQLGLILFLLLFSRFLGVSRKQVSFGISLGFGFLAAVELMLMALHARGLVARDSFNLTNMLTYNLAVFVWLGYSLSHQAAREPASNRLQTQRWEHELADLQHPVPSDSMIPRFEEMVERAFSRSSSLEAAGNHSQLNRPATPLKANSAAAGSSVRP
jgi:hypothetical protein